MVCITCKNHEVHHKACIFKQCENCCLTEQELSKIRR